MLKRPLLLGGLIALILVGGGIYVLCIPCQYYEYRSLPGVDEVLANPVDRPDPIATIWLNASINEPRKNEPRLCVEIIQRSLMTRNKQIDIQVDLQTQIPSITDHFFRTIKLFIDNYRQTLIFMGTSDGAPVQVCADVGGFEIGQHVAFVTVQAPSSQEYNYTWVFEITKDEIIPQVS